MKAEDALDLLIERAKQKAPGFEFNVPELLDAHPPIVTPQRRRVGKLFSNFCKNEGFAPRDITSRRNAANLRIYKFQD